MKYSMRVRSNELLHGHHQIHPYNLKYSPSCSLPTTWKRSWLAPSSPFRSGDMQPGHQPNPSHPGHAVYDRVYSFQTSHRVNNFFPTVTSLLNSDPITLRNTPHPYFHHHHQWTVILPFTQPLVDTELQNVYDPLTHSLRYVLFLLSSPFFFRMDVLKLESPQEQLSELIVRDSWEALLAIRACMRGAKRPAMPLHLYSLSLPVGSSTHCHF